MDKSILRRIIRIEAKAFPADGVGLLELQDDGTWLLIEDGKLLGQFATQEAGKAAFKGQTLIILDI